MIVCNVTTYTRRRWKREKENETEFVSYLFPNDAGIYLFKIENCMKKALFKVFT